MHILTDIALFAAKKSSFQVSKVLVETINNKFYILNYLISSPNRHFSISPFTRDWKNILFFPLTVTPSNSFQTLENRKSTQTVSHLSTCSPAARSSEHLERCPCYILPSYFSKKHSKLASILQIISDLSICSSTDPSDEHVQRQPCSESFKSSHTCYWRF